MPARRNRRTAKETRTGSNAMGIQKQINQDYKYLVKDYGMLGAELLKKPLTRYILGGVALVTLAPFVMRFFRREEVQTFVRENVEGIRHRIDDVIHSGDAERV